MHIKNGNILNSRTRQFERRDLFINKGKIADPIPEDAEILDAQGLYVLPGFIDTHIHGFYNCDFGTPGTDLTPARMELARQGTTAFAATVSTRPMADLCATATWLAEQMGAPAPGAKLCGIHS